MRTLGNQLHRSLLLVMCAPQVQLRQRSQLCGAWHWYCVPYTARHSTLPLATIRSHGARHVARHGCCVVVAVAGILNASACYSFGTGTTFTIEPMVCMGSSQVGW